MSMLCSPLLGSRRPRPGSARAAAGAEPELVAADTGKGALGVVLTWLRQKLGFATASLVLVWLAFFCDYALMTIVIPIFPLLDKPQWLIGVLFAAKAACQIISSPVMARFVDRHEKAMIVSGLILEACSVCVFALTFSYRAWFMARALSGVASAAITSAGLAHLAKRYSDNDERAVAMGLATTGIVAGVCLGPVLGGTLYELHPALPFMLLAALQLSAAGGACTLLPQLQSQGQQEKQAEAAAAGAEEAKMKDMLRDPAVLRPMGALVTANAAISSLESTIARFLSGTFGLSAGQIGATFLLVSVPSCIGAGCSGPVGNRIGRPMLLRTGLLLQGFFTALGPKSFAPLLPISLVGLGIGMGFVDGSTPPILGQVADERFGGTGKIFVLSNAAVQMGFVLGPIAGNAVAQACGFGAACAMNGGVLLAYAAFMTRMRNA